jgi:hypothetical protein
MEVFQLKGSALLWWKTLLPQLNMVVEDVSWELFEERFQERYLSDEFIEHQLNEFNALRQGSHTVPEYEARYMELLRYAPHLNTEKLKVNKFVFGLNFNIHAKVRILMPQTLHDAVQKALIVEEEMNSGGQGRTPSRQTDRHHLEHQQHQTPVRQTSGHRGTCILDTTMTNSSSEDSLQSTTTKQQSIINNNNNSLDLVHRTDQYNRLLGQQLLLLGLGAPDQRMDVGHVESHITRETVLLRRKELSDHQDLRQLEIWARPTGYMQW